MAKKYVYDGCTDIRSPIDRHIHINESCDTRNHNKSTLINDNPLNRNK